MNKIGSLVLNIAVALYLFANGILGFSDKLGDKLFGGGAFRMMANTIFSGDLVNVVTIILSICGIVAGALMLLTLLKIEVPATDMILVVFIIVWLVCIVIIDIINPLSSNTKVKFLDYLIQLSIHLMVLGALVTSTKRFG